MEQIQVLYVGAAMPGELSHALRAIRADIRTVRTANEARQTLAEWSCSVAVVDTPLPDEFGTALAADLAERPDQLVLLLVPVGQYDPVADRATDFGIMTLAKPLDTEILRQSLALLLAAERKLAAMRRQTSTLEEKMADIRFVNRAKLLLVEREGMTEAEAHRHIGKLSMELGMKRRQVALKIIHRYD